MQLDDALMRDAKRAALESGRTLTAVIEDALRQALSRRKKSVSRRPVKFTTFGGKGLLPEVGLDDSAGLLDRMEPNRKGEGKSNTGRLSESDYSK